MSARLERSGHVPNPNMRISAAVSFCVLILLSAVGVSVAMEELLLQQHRLKLY